MWPAAQSDSTKDSQMSKDTEALLILKKQCRLNNHIYKDNSNACIHRCRGFDLLSQSSRE